MINLNMFGLMMFILMIPVVAGMYVTAYQDGLNYQEYKVLFVSAILFSVGFGCLLS